MHVYTPLNLQVSSILAMSFPGHLSDLENLGVGIARISADGSWVANQRLREMLAFSHEQTSTSSFDTIFQTEHLAAEAEQRKRLLAGEILNYSSERSVTRADGQRLRIRAVFSLHRNGSVPEPGILSTIEDLS